MRIFFFQLALLLCFPLSVLASDATQSSSYKTIAKNIVCTEPLSPKSIEETSPGSSRWETIENVREEDGKMAIFDNHSTNQIKDIAVKLVLADGSIGSEGKTISNRWTDTPKYVAYGNDLWDTNLNPKDVNNANFGVGIQVGGGMIDSFMLKVTNFGFQIPLDATISGITAEIKRHNTIGTANGGSTYGYVDHVRMTICYIPPLEVDITPVKSLIQPSPEAKPNKMFSLSRNLKQLIYLILLSGVSYALFLAFKKLAIHNYSNVPDENRAYYETISDMITQMHNSIGDSAFKIADAVGGLAVDRKNGRVLNITKNPDEVISALFIRYENAYKKKLKVDVRPSSKKTKDKLSSAKNAIDKYEKYFRKK